MNAVAHCWRTIGVHGGDHSCERLAEVLHCRNCPVFSGAARNLLQRESAAVADDAGLDDAGAGAGRATALVFRIGRQWLGLPPALVGEVGADPPVRRLAHRTAGRIEGVVNVRGELRLCIAFGELLGLGRRTESGRGTRLVLIEDAGGPLAFRCDEVRGLVGYPPERETPPPDTLRAPLDECVRALLPEDDGVAVALLDGEAVARLLRAAVFG
ncbi:chemotaxis protein CheW [Arenimonas composti]|uniref:CheW-like domain-containing protein n=1 Tax=Arenimonas composti TR7-09 = DSM 18010 TaxID=1121013 RepID=A0A091BW49_9GAMM|nr:chemotaxis protein CheW [Arenimonas composti]KFN48570.1 hypothetical protein P873_14225 [Arenimonas composti TR7-09 = DSM 18010]